MNIDDLLREIDANVERFEKAAEAALHRVFTAAVPHGLGTVMVDGEGRLLSVELDDKALSRVDAATVGQSVVLAIRDASARTGERR